VASKTDRFNKSSKGFVMGPSCGGHVEAPVRTIHNDVMDRDGCKLVRRPNSRRQTEYDGTSKQAVGVILMREIATVSHWQEYPIKEGVDAIISGLGHPRDQNGDT
jgi:hypothetical protein